MEVVRTSRDFSVDIEPDRLWPIFSNTDEMNRAVNFDAVTYENPAEGSVLRTAHSKLLGILPSSWEEPPYEFVAGSYYAINRKMNGGPFSSYSFSMRLYPEGEGTRVELALDIIGRGAFGAWIAPIAAPKILGKMAGGLQAFSNAAVSGSRTVFSPPKSSPRVDRRALSGLISTIKSSVSQTLLEKIERHLLTAPDADVLSMRPFLLADAWNADRMETLRAFLLASRGGVFNLSWEILCPNCRIPKSGFSALADLRSEAHCDFCEIDFNGKFDRNVEVRFSVHPSVRKPVHADFCIGSPSKSPHRMIQAPVGPDETRVFRVHLKNQSYFARGLKESSRAPLIPDESASDSITIRFSNGKALEGEIRFKPGVVSVRLENTGAAASWCAVDGETWSDLGATAALVTTLQDFRDLFSSEVLAPDQKIAIENLAVVFTDLKDSTAMYSRIGDAKAYALVRTHFEILLRTMRDNNGAIVKTIGDAVMAAFSSTTDAVAAAVGIQKAIASYNASRDPQSPPIIVKLGIHTGPAIAVTMNEMLDYFGTTINTAARVQSTSEGHDIVVTSEVLKTPGVREQLEHDGGTLEEFAAGLKGLSNDYRLWRFSPKSATIT